MLMGKKKKKKKKRRKKTSFNTRNGDLIIRTINHLVSLPMLHTSKTLVSHILNQDMTDALLQEHAYMHK